MRFITEFELVPPAIEARLDAYKSSSEFKLGQLIAQSFGWDHKGSTTLEANSPVKERFTLEIEAFPMDKWVEFKKRLTDALPDYDSTSRVRLINALGDLESFVTKKPG